MSFTFFLAQILLSLGLSLAVLLYLRSMLFRVLLGLCRDHEDGARYWIKMLDVMMLIAPLILVVLFGGMEADPYHLLRRTLLLGLIGQFISLCIVGYNVNRYTALEQAARLAPPTARPVTAHSQNGGGL